MRQRHRRAWPALLPLLLLLVAGPSRPAQAEDYTRVSGEGSSWAGNAIASWSVNVGSSYNMEVDYNPTGSTAGRANFLIGQVDFAASDIPFQFHPEDGSAPENPAPDSYAYIPVVAGGTAFVYNLKINGQQVTNLRLSGENVAKIFTGTITMWNDPAIVADNPGLTLPARTIVPVVRADGSGSTAQFTMWMIDRHRAIWEDFCHRAGKSACGYTSFYPPASGMIAQVGDQQVAGYVAASHAEGAIGYVNYSYALGQSLPVAKVLNAAGFYTEPTPDNVAVSLLKAKINTDKSDPAVYLTQQLGEVYTDSDPRNYQLSSYSYFILPTKEQGQFDADKGKTVAAFAYYAMCQGQEQAASLGYSPMPINLVQASFEQIRKIPGAEVQNIDVANCHNPTFSTDGTNTLAENAAMPLECDRQGIPTQCEFGTGGNLDQTAVSGGGSAYGPGQPGGEQPGGEQPGGEQPGGEQPGGEQPGGEQPGGEQPGGEQPGGEQPGGEQPGGQQPGGQPQAGGGGGGGGGGASSTTSTTVPCVPPTTTPGSSTTAPPGANSSSPTSSAAPTSTGAPGSTTAPTSTTTPCAPTSTTTPNGVATTVPGGQICDPDTGICTADAGGSQGLQSEANVERAVDAVQTTTLGGGSGWGWAQTLMLIVAVLLAAAVIVVPSVAWRRFANPPVSS